MVTKTTELPSVAASDVAVGDGYDEASVLATLQGRFSIVDYCVFALLLGVSAVIGLWFGLKKRQKTTEDFLMGGRSMGTFPMAMSLIASFMSAIALLGTPAETYQHGTMYWLIGVAYVITIPAAAYLYFPVFYKLNVMSAYEYLDRRFNRFMRCLGSAIFSIQMTIYMAIVVYAPALALSQVTGMNVYLSVTLIFIVCIFYCVAGGMKAVMWTDTVQVIIMYAAIVAVILKGVFDVGGFGAVWDASKKSGRIEFSDFSVDPTVRHTWWSIIIGGYFTWIAIYGVNQAQVQRYLSVPTMARARNALWINLVGLLFLVSMCSYAGLVIYAKYQTCDPLKAKIVSTSDQLFPLFVMDTMGDYPGIPGVFVAGIFSGALSTVSSGLNSLAAITLEDFVKPYCFKNMDEAKATMASRILSLMFGVLSFVLVFVAEQLGNVLQAALSVFGMIGGPLLGMFTLGMFFPWANNKGAMAGALGGLAITFWIGTGAQIAKSQGFLAIPKKPVSTEGCAAFYDQQPALQEMLNSSLARIMAAELRMSEQLQAITKQPSLLDHGADSGLEGASFVDGNTDEAWMPLLGLYGVSYLWYSAIGCMAVIIIGMIVSLLTGVEDMKKMNPDLISPGTVFIMNLLPKDVQKRLRWELGTEYDPKTLKGSESKESMGLEYDATLGKLNFGMESSVSSLPSLMIPSIDGKTYSKKHEEANKAQQGHLAENATKLTMVSDEIDSSLGDLMPSTGGLEEEPTAVPTPASTTGKQFQQGDDGELEDIVIEKNSDEVQSPSVIENEDKNEDASVTSSRRSSSSSSSASSQPEAEDVKEQDTTTSTKL